MKKLLLLTKTLLAAALLCVGQNAWGKEANLTPTADTYFSWANGDTSYGSDETLYCGIWQEMWTDATPGLKMLNNQSANGKMAVFKFDVSDYKGKITGATFKVTATNPSTNTNTRSIYLGYFDLTNWTESSTANTSGMVTRNKTGLNIHPFNLSQSIAKGQTKEVSFSSGAFLTYLNEDEDGIVSLIIYGLSQECYVNSKEAASGKPSLTLTYTDETVYTATFTANSGAITPTVTIYSDAGRTSLVTNGTLLDKTTYYYRATLHGYNNYEGSFTVNGANPSESFTMTAAPAVKTLTVKAKIGSSSYAIKSIDLDDKYVGDAYSFVYPKYYLLEGTLYETAKGTNANGWYKWNGTLPGNTVEIEYNTTAATNVVYYKEGEDIEGMEESTPTNADIRCSNGKGGRSDDLVTLKNLGAGIYKIASGVWGSEGASFTFKVDGEDVYTNSTTGSLNTSETVFSIVSGNADVKVKGTSTSGKALDYVYIQKVAESDGLIFNGDFSNATWNAGWLGTGSDKKAAFVKQSSASGFDGNIAEMWTDAGFTAEGNIYQVLINVPAGDYVVSANILNNVAGGAAVLYAKVGSADDVTTAAAGLATKTEKTLAFTVSEVSNVKIGYKTTNITGKTGWIAVDDFRFVVPIAISSYGWATFSSDYALDFSKATTGLEAYMITGHDGTVVTKSQVTGTVPAGTGLLLKGAEGDYNIPIVANSETNVSENKMKAGTGEEVSAEEGKTKYVLGVSAGGEAEFQKIVSEAATVPTGKAYLQFEETIAARSMRFSGDITAVETVEAVSEAKAKEGKFIENGKLVIVKNGVKFNAAGAKLY